MTLLACVSFVGIGCTQRNMKIGEMTLFYTVGSTRNVLFQTYLIFVTIYGLIWSCSVKLST